MYRRAFPLLLIVLALAPIAACSDSSTDSDPSPLPISETFISVLLPERVSMAVGDSTQLRSVAARRDGVYEMVTTAGTWLSSNPRVATVDEFGVVRAIQAGNAEITVGLDGLTGTAAVEVTDGAAATVTYQGTAAGANNQGGSVTLSVTASPLVSGTLYIGKRATSLIGRIDLATNIVNVTGSGFAVIGVRNGSVIAGAFTDPNGATGGFAAIDASRVAVTPFCGTYSSDGTTPLGFPDTGAFVLAISLDGTVVGASVSSDASATPVTFVGTRAGDAVTLRSNSGETTSGTVQRDKATGTFRTGAGSPATFTVAQSGCQ